MALLDFDVHHGNGTQACAAGAAPGVARYAFKTPTSEGVQTFPVFRPWLDFDDADNILFARRAPAPAAGARVQARPRPGRSCSATCFFTSKRGVSERGGSISLPRLCLLL